MPIPGLSLVGFMDERAGVRYLRQACVFRGTTSAALKARWNEAHSQRGAAVATPGVCDVQELPAEASSYLSEVPRNKRFAGTIQGSAGWSFKAVEIAPLIAYQLHVCTDQQVVSQDAAPPTLMDALPKCLPQELPAITFNFSVNVRPDGGEFTVTSDELNLVAMLGEAGLLGADQSRDYQFAGVPFGPNSPLVQVVRVGGRCYLRNGYHRCYQFGSAGLTHIPCVLLEANDLAAVLPNAPGAIFEKPLLTSANPPTCGHLIDGRAYPVSLRRAARVIRVTWAQGVSFVD